MSTQVTIKQSELNTDSKLLVRGDCFRGNSLGKGPNQHFGSHQQIGLAAVGVPTPVVIEGAWGREVVTEPPIITPLSPQVVVDGAGWVAGGMPSYACCRHR
jgi:hypothetical protein